MRPNATEDERSYPDTRRGASDAHGPCGDAMPTQDLSFARKYATVKMTAHHSKKYYSGGLSYSTITGRVL